jgi:hypothetical protein
LKLSSDGGVPAAINGIGVIMTSELGPQGVCVWLVSGIWSQAVGSTVKEEETVEFARKSEEGLLQYCKIGSEPVGFIFVGFLLLF